MEDMGVMMNNKRTNRAMTPRQAWVTIIAFIALTLWLLIGSIIAILDDPPTPITPATAPNSHPVIYEEEP